MNIFSVILIICSINEQPCDFAHSITGIATTFGNLNNSKTACLDFFKEQVPYFKEQIHMTEDPEGTVIYYKCTLIGNK